MKKIVEIPEKEDARKKAWRKTITQVNREISNGYAFVGDWLTADESYELNVGDYILAYDEKGSRKHTYILVRFFQVTNEGLHLLYDWEGNYGQYKWAIHVRDKIADIIEENNTDSNADQEAILIAEAEAEALLLELELINL